MNSMCLRFDDELRNFLSGKLPDYMIPVAFLFLDKLPLTPNGKVDRGALPAPDGIRPELSEAYVAPRTEVEQTIAAIWQELLGIDKVGSHDNFFDLGGHSLLMVQANSELRIAFERDISTIDMFKYPTVNSLAEYLTKDQDDPGSLQQSKTRAETRREFMKRRKKLTQRTPEALNPEENK